VLNENSGPNGNLGWDDARLADETAAALRDLASTVTDAPPIRLKAPATSRARAARRARGARRWSWGAPALAAVTIAAVAIALVLVRNIPNGRVPSPAPSATSATPVNPTLVAGVPEYYVAWMQADRPYLMVGNTLDGGSEGIIPSPKGIYLNGVYGAAADDRTFIVTGTRVPAPGTTVWYLLRLRQGQSPMTMATLPIPVPQDPAGVALSPDGTQVAVAVNGSPATLRVYSVATGALQHSWTAPSGKFAALKTTSNSWQFTQLVLRWTTDGRQVAFAWNAKQILSIGTTAPDGSLLANGSVLAAIGTTQVTDGTFTCNAWQGWEPVTVTRGPSAGQGVICGGGALNELPQTVNPTANPSASHTAGKAACSARTQPSVGFLMATKNSGDSYLGITAGETECPATAQTGDGAYIGWSNADGSIVIGSLVWDGHARFGIFRGQRFTPLPKLPVSMPVPTGMLVGTDAW
jgi:hypothetical protein